MTLSKIQFGASFKVCACKTQQIKHEFSKEKVLVNKSDAPNLQRTWQERAEKEMDVCVCVVVVVAGGGSWRCRKWGGGICFDQECAS